GDRGHDCHRRAARGLRDGPPQAACPDVDELPLGSAPAAQPTQRQSTAHVPEWNWPLAAESMRRSPRSEEPQRRLKRPAGGFSQRQCALIQQTASNKAGLSRRQALSAPGLGGFVEQRQSRIAILWRQPMEVDARVKAGLSAQRYRFARPTWVPFTSETTH